MSYEAYRPWLRDEFAFRCVYCLKREMWGQVTFDFEIDHIEPQSINPARRLDYLNLVYACRRCNGVKLNKVVSDPFVLLRSDRLVTMPDGSLRVLDIEARRLVQQLDLNSGHLRNWRVLWMRLVDLSEETDQELLSLLVGLLSDLPDLSRLSPQENSRPEGISESWLERHRRGERLVMH